MAMQTSRFGPGDTEAALVGWKVADSVWGIYASSARSKSSAGPWI